MNRLSDATINSKYYITLIPHTLFWQIEINTVDIPEILKELPLPCIQNKLNIN